MLSNRMLRILVGASLAALPLAIAAQAQEGPAPVRFATIDGGRDHYCALDTSGGVWCWGRNDFGQLGDGTTSSSNVPVAVTGLSAGVRIIAAGEEHSCALDAAGQAWCWGRNLAGGLGDLTTNDSSVPVAVQMLGTGASDIDVGQSHSCALDRRGRALCWGWNAWGILGDGTDINHVAPAPVAVLGQRLQGLALAENRSCTINRNGRAYCWGNNGSGQLGDGTQSERRTPTAVQGIGRAVVRLAAGGDHTCAQDLRGRSWCWGFNGVGALGDGTMESRLTPVEVAGMGLGGSSITAGREHSCALNRHGRAYCWGVNWAGMLGDGTGDQRLTPVPVAGLGRGLLEIAAGGYSTCALDVQHQAWCWGSNYWGALGDGTNAQRLAPVPVVMPLAP